MLETAFGYSDKLPEKIREPFVWLCQDLVGLQTKWDFFEHLYDSQENAALLSELALASFNVIRGALVTDFVMGISRLTDPPQSGRAPVQDNLTLSALVLMCADVPEAAEWQLQCDNLKTIAEPMRRQRNKRLAHRDLNTAINPKESPLPGVSKADIKRFLQGATDLMNMILQHFDDAELYFHGPTHGGAESLLFWLNLGKASADREREAMLKGGI
jgi:hypothetical protein